MKFAEFGNSSLLSQFREFYRYLTRLEMMVRAGTWDQPASAQPAAMRAMAGAVGFTSPQPSTEIVRGGSSGGANSHRMAAAVRQRLLLLFEHQARDAQTYGSEFYREAQYVMAALADEIFLQLDWEGRSYWLSNLIETQLFQTHISGELFFQRLDRILQDRDPALKELASVYFMALSLGFRGKYRGYNDNGLLTLYRQQLYTFIFQKPADLSDARKQLFPEAYQYTEATLKRRRLPDTRFWVGVLLLVVVLFIGISHVLWTGLVAPLEESSQKIINDNSHEVNQR
ncbi:MAG TPA: DotU family type IV/VI secretion system protein [Blastocatellia bacterium]|nr:DotU family type IV/VI secretion system protein [Blastocatellia bacterium]